MKLCACVIGTLGGQERELDVLELERQEGVSCTLHPLQEYFMLSTAETSLQASFDIFKKQTFFIFICLFT